MSEIVRIGGVGKNPAIDKIHKLNEVDVKNYAVRKIEEVLLGNNMEKQEYGRNVPIDFSKTDWEGTHYGEGKISEMFEWCNGDGDTDGI